MYQLQLRLDFLCEACDEGIQVTVQCTGKGLASGPRTIAAASVPCPFCREINQVCFHPTGTVVAVHLVERRGRLAVPSAN